MNILPDELVTLVYEFSGNYKSKYEIVLNNVKKFPKFISYKHIDKKLYHYIFELFENENCICFVNYTYKQMFMYAFAILNKKKIPLCCICVNEYILCTCKDEEWYMNDQYTIYTCGICKCRYCICGTDALIPIIKEYFSNITEEKYLNIYEVFHNLDNSLKHKIYVHERKHTKDFNFAD